MLLAKPSAEHGKSGQSTQTQVARALVEALTKLTAGTSTLIVIEDLHLLDLESIYCLRLMGEHGVRPLYAAADGTTGVACRGPDIAAMVLRLDPLPRAEMRELAHQLWPQGAPPPSIVDKVLDRADGVPFVLEQIVLSIEDQHQPVPQSVQSVIHARLNRLSSSARSAPRR